MSAPTVGELAPAFALSDASGVRVSLHDFKGKWVILYCYPKDDTPGCTKEACGFRDAQSQLTRRNAVVLGMSLDDATSHRRFADKFQLPFRLLCDTDAKISKAYGVYKQKSLYGRTFWGIERTTFLIEPDGKIAQIFPRVKVDGHVEEVLAALLKEKPGGSDPPFLTH